MKYFEVKKIEGEIFTAIGFLKKATSKDGSGHYGFNCIKIEKNRMLSTDGHRAHVADIESGITNGHYEIIAQGKAKFILLERKAPNFPDIDSIIPKPSKNPIKYYGGKSDTSVSKLMGQLYKKGTGVNYRFILDLMQDRDWYVYIGKAHEPSLFIHAEYTAVIMPYLIDKVS